MWAMCRWSGIGWMVILKDRTYEKSRMIKVKDVIRRTEQDVHRTALVAHLLFVLQRARSGHTPMATPGAKKAAPRHPHPSGVTEREANSSLSVKRSGKRQDSDADTARTVSVLPQSIKNTSKTAGAQGETGKLAQNALDIILLNADKHSRKRKIIAAEANRAVGNVANCVNPRLTKVSRSLPCLFLLLRR